MFTLRQGGMTVGAIYCIIEACRYIEFIQLRDKLRKSQTPLSDDFSHDEWFNFITDRFKRHPQYFKKFIECAFWYRPYDTVDRDSIRSCLYTLLTASEIHNMDRLIGEKDKIDTYKNTIEEIVIHHTHDNPAKHDTPLPFIRISDPNVNYGEAYPLFRPLPLELAFDGLRCYGDTVLLANGFRRQVADNGFVFWIKETIRTGNTLCFIHGLGFGAVPYIHTISKIAEDNKYDNVIFIESPGISGNPAPKIKITAQETAETICGVIGVYPNMDVIAHSHGTCMLSYIENRNSTIFKKRVYIDPLCFFPVNTKSWPIAFKKMDFLSLFKPFTLRNVINTIMLSEPYHSHLIHNHSYMYEFVHRERNLNGNVMLLIGGRDDMVPSVELHEYMQNNYPEVSLHYFADDKHGKFSSTSNHHYHRVINEFLQFSD